MALSIRALPDTGTISMLDVIEEIDGVRVSRLISLNDSDVRDLAEKPSGRISMHDLHGKTKGTVVEISSNQHNFNLSSHVPNDGTEILVHIYSTATIGSIDPQYAAFTVPSSLAGRTISIENSGKILGAGGKGGRGAGSSGAGTSGQTGGTALLIQAPVTIKNNLTIAGGGGGGGGGGASAGKGGATGTGGGGGGGAGYNAGSGGTGASTGGSGNTTTGGAGAGGSGTGKTGGKGGNIGRSGAGGGGGGTISPGGGGAAGYYASGYSKITWTATGTRIGRTTG